MNGGPGPPMYPSSHHMRLPGPPQSRMAAAQPRPNGQQYSSLMQPQLQRQVGTGEGGSKLRLLTRRLFTDSSVSKSVQTKRL